MKCLTLIQPWATLWALGIKLFETRSWPTRYRGLLHIHAGKKVDDAGAELWNSELIQKELGKIAERYAPYRYVSFESLPRQCIIGTVDLVSCYAMTPDLITEATLLELACGDWKPGRFAWGGCSNNLWPADQFIDVKGQLGIWEYERTAQEELDIQRRRQAKAWFASQTMGKKRSKTVAARSTPELPILTPTRKFRLE